MKQRKRVRREPTDEADQTLDAPVSLPIAYQPLSAHYIEAARKKLASLAESLESDDVPSERWYVDASEALMLLLGTGCDAARITWTPEGAREMRANLIRLMKDQSIIAPGRPTDI